MSSPSREQLLGYLVGALEPDEQDQVAAELDLNPTLRDELQRLGACIGRIGLSEEPQTYDPPIGLADRTCRYVAAEASQILVTPGGALAYHVESHRRFTWLDFVALGAVVLAAVTIFIPALSFSRFNAQVAACENQLRLIGFGLHGYSELQPDHTFPGPDLEGNRATAGVVAPILVSNSLAESSVFICPSSALSRERNGFRVPLLEELDKAAGSELLAWHRSMGGDYGYNLGYLVDGRLLRPSNARRVQYVLVADSPSNSQPRRVSANHRGRGQNILYEDGHVEFITRLPSPKVPDDPYHNRQGWVAAGVDRDDAVLGASADPPLPGSLIEELER